MARAADEGAQSLAAGRRIGPYRILTELGHGGMGVVYLAERADAAYEKQVAIKVVRAAAFAGESLMQRFREERRILATLDHPNIARLLDGGTTEDGIPYLVMEYVDGIPLDIHSQALRLSMGQRLSLFREVCAAVQYAHQHLVIHRDLKPRNILVTADGTPKLLDFGIAKLVEPGLETEETRTGMRALSLEGASPEQVRGEPLTVTSDVYALGVLLYRLLSGESPYGPARRSEADLMRAIAEEAPLRPSAVAPVEERRHLRGELDWITLKALRKEPDRRYASVEQLAADIQRHLDGRPIAAAPDSWIYRARKFTERNRTPVAVGTLLIVSLVGGATATLWQARRAEEQRARAEGRFGDVRKLANSFLFEFHDAIKDLPGSTAARRLVAAKALEYLDSLAREQAHDPELSLELAIAYQKVGEILGSPNVANLGDTAGALRSVQKAIDIEEALVRSDPGRRSYQENLAKAYLLQSQLHGAASDERASLDAARRGLGTMERLAAAHPEDAAIRRELPRHYDRLGDVASNMGDLEDGLRQYQKAGAVIEAVLGDAPQDESALRALMANYDSIAINLGNPRYPNLDDPAGALVVITKAVSLSAEKSKIGSAATSWLGHGLISMGEIQTALGDWTGALASYRRAVAWWESLVAADASDVYRKLFLAFALTELGDALSETGRAVEAQAALRRAIEITTRLSRADPASGDHRAYLAFAQAVYGGVLAKHGDDDGALRSHEESIGLYRGLVEKNGVNLQLRLEMAAPCLGTGRVYMKRARRTRKSAEHCQRALPDLECVKENYAELQRHFRLTRKQSREQAEAEAAIRWCQAPKTVTD